MARRPFNQAPALSAADRTMTLYTALMLILVSFFLFLVSRANFDETKYATALESIRDRFGLLTGGRLAAGSNEGLPDLTLAINDQGSLTGPEVELARIRALLAPDIINREARIIHTRGQRVISLSAGLVFKPDSWELNSKAAETLLAISQIMAPGAVPITIEGHTDSHPPLTRGIGDNWDISGRRAMTVLKFLAEEGGMDPRLLSAFAYGGAKPLYTNMTPGGRAGNNRVDLVLDFSALKEREIKDLADRAATYHFKGFDFLIREGGR